MDTLARAGVVGGIPEVAHIKAELWPGDNVQAALDSGGPGVVFLHNGTYELWDPLYMRQGVVLRGEHRNNVTLSVRYRSTWKRFAVQFNADSGCSYAGLENPRSADRSRSPSAPTAITPRSMRSSFSSKRAATATTTG